MPSYILISTLFRSFFLLHLDTYMYVYKEFYPVHLDVQRDWSAESILSFLFILFLGNVCFVWSVWLYKRFIFPYSPNGNLRWWKSFSIVLKRQLTSSVERLPWHDPPIRMLSSSLWKKYPEIVYIVFFFLFDNNGFCPCDNS